jgi:hypothetical protein
MLLGSVVALISGCGSSEKEFPGRGPEAVDRPATAPTRSRWSQYLVVMSDKERTEFLSIADDTQREKWLRRTGIDVRAELSSSLSRGISVEAARGRLDDAPEEVKRDGRTTMLFYSRYNTESRTHYWLKFENDQLLSWNSYTKNEMDREREVLEFEQALMRKFNTVLERGMGMNEINRQAAAARDNLNKVEGAYRERISEPEYKGVYSKPGSRDYIIAENLLHAQRRNELFQWFQGRAPDRVIIHRPFETHRYFVLHRDLRGNETIVNAEFIFEDSRLVDWFVYHDK